MLLIVTHVTVSSEQLEYTVKTVSAFKIINYNFNISVTVTVT